MIARPLVVDLDGTLINTDVLLESGFAFLKRAPHHFYLPLLWLLRGGKSALKAGLSAQTQIDVTALPYNADVLTWLTGERAAGRPIVLATASHERYAQQISAHLGLFDKTFATHDDVNLSAAAKRDALVAQYGEHGFDYAGNSRDDVPVWKAAERAYVVNASPAVERAARRNGNVERVIDGPRAHMKIWAKSLRVHQWLKNFLIFIPLLAAHQAMSPALDIAALIAFISFSLCASSVYLLNDLVDLDDDRHHPVKRHRPLAAGALPLSHAIVACPILLAASFALAWLTLPWRFGMVLLAYYALTLAYSLTLKKWVMVDVVVLAALYTARIIAGATAVSAHLTFWLLAFSMCIFLSLALVKRYAELLTAQTLGAANPRGRGYTVGDLPLVSQLGIASGYMSVLVLALYVQDANTVSLYRHPHLIWLACPLVLFWVGRTWVVTHRGQMHDDPIVFAARDRISLAICALTGLIFAVAV